MTWVTRWKYPMAKNPVRGYPGLFRLRDGGYFGRSRITLPSGKRREVTVVARTAKTPAEAQRELESRVAEEQAKAHGRIPTRTLWSDFAVSYLEGRVRRGKVESAATLERWDTTLGRYLVPAFGHLPASEVTRHHIEDWIERSVLVWMRDGLTVERKRRRDGKLVMVPFVVALKPTTVNGWLRILKEISGAVQIKFGLAQSAFDGIEFLDEGRIYTKEQPNALPPDDDTVQRFLAAAREMYPQHYAMILLGFVTGLRPSSLRPLRRAGSESDIDWTTGVLQVRRSHSRKQVVMNRTKTKHDTTIGLPAAVIEVLEWHVRTQLTTPEQQASALLFPTEDGKLRTRNVLAKPFAAIAKALGLRIHLTPRGMRRTFNDVARHAGIHDVVTRSISGHRTEQMQHHYSTALAKEQRRELEKVHARLAGEQEQPS